MPDTMADTMADPTSIFSWLRLDDRLTTSGQPSEAQLHQLAALGVQHIINLGLHSHERALPDEAASVQALGLHYIHIPVAFDAPTEGDYQQFVGAMHSLGDDMVHVHCIVNARVSAFLYRYRRDHLGVSEPVARAAMMKIWTPGGVWADFIGDAAASDQPHIYHISAP